MLWFFSLVVAVHSCFLSLILENAHSLLSSLKHSLLDTYSLLWRGIYLLGFLDHALFLRYIWFYAGWNVSFCTYRDLHIWIRFSLGRRCLSVLATLVFVHEVELLRFHYFFFLFLERVVCHKDLVSFISGDFL